MEQLEHSPDRDIIERVLSGSVEEFSVLVDRYFGIVRAIAVARVGNAADAEDIVQETFLKAFESLDRLRERESFGAWLRTIARNACNTLMGRRRRETLLEGANGETPATYESPTERDEMAKILEERILGLDEAKRELLLLRYFAGKSLAEIAKVLDANPNTVAKRLQRARETLGERMLEELDSPPYRPSRKEVSGLMGVVLSAPHQWSRTTTPVVLAGRYTWGKVTGWLLEHKAAMVTILAAGAFLGYQGLRASNVSGDLEDRSRLTSYSAEVESAVARKDAGAPVAMRMAASQETEEGIQAPGDESSAGVAKAEEVDLSDPQAIWRKVVEVNRVWLRPEPEFLRYTMKMDDESYRVWIAGEQGRYKSDRPDSPVDLVFSGAEAVGIAPRSGVERSPYPMNLLAHATLRQGVKWFTSLHILARQGLPQNARIIETAEHGDGRRITIEADVKEHRTSLGLGLLDKWYGSTGYAPRLVRITISTPLFVPILEEGIQDYKDGELLVSVVEVGPEFMEVGGQLAPAALRHLAPPMDHLESWILSANFQIVNDVWIFKDAENIHNGVTVKRIHTTNISTEPFDLAIVEMPSEEELATLKAAWPPAEELAYGDALDRPRVISVSPQNGASEIATDSELRVAFDRPMSPNSVKIEFERGGYIDIGDIHYDPGTFQFTIPIQLAAGERHRVYVNGRSKLPGSLRDRGFRSVGGIGSNRYVWQFETRPETPNSDGEAPQVVSVSPASGETAACLTLLRIQYDRPMDPKAYAIEDLGDTSGRGRARILHRVEYDQDSSTFVVPIEMPPEQENHFSLVGFRSTEGVESPPYELHLNTKSEPISAEHEKQLDEAGKDPRLFSTLTQMRRTREAITSLSEVVHTIRQDYVRGRRLSRGLNADGAIFKLSDGGRIYGDISEIMGSAFLVAADGEHCWHYWYGKEQERLSLEPYDAVGHKNVSLADPFGLLERDIQEAIDALHLEYRGLVSDSLGSWHLLRSTTCSLFGGPSTRAQIAEWWIDASTMLPDLLMQYYRGSSSQRVFEYVSINQPIPSEDFRPIGFDRLTPQTIPLEEGLDTHFLDLRDGADGHMTVRWGLMGPAGRNSSGLN